MMSSPMPSNGSITAMCSIGREGVADLEEALEEPAVLDDGDLGAAVVHQVLDLFGRRRVVDRHGRGAAEQHGEVERVELRPVADHQHDLVAVADTEILEAPT